MVHACVYYYKSRMVFRHVFCGHGLIQSGGGGAEKSQNIGFLSYTGPDPLKNHKATKPAFNVGPLSARQ